MERCLHRGGVLLATGRQDTVLPPSPDSDERQRGSFQFGLGFGLGSVGALGVSLASQGVGSLAFPCHPDVAWGKNIGEQAEIPLLEVPIRVRVRVRVRVQVRF